MGHDTEPLAAELKVFTENDSDIYRGQTTAILKNLATKKASGKYNRERAVDAFMALAETGAKKYAQVFGGGSAAPWHEMFPVACRRLVAEEWRNEFEVEYGYGNYDNMLPEKYQKSSTRNYMKGDRVQLHPSTDHWMRGDRYGDVVRVTNSKVTVKLDKSGNTVSLLPDKILEKVI